MRFICVAFLCVQFMHVGSSDGQNKTVMYKQREKQQQHPRKQSQETTPQHQQQNPLQQQQFIYKGKCMSIKCLYHKDGGKIYYEATKATPNTTFNNDLLFLQKSIISHTNENIGTWESSDECNVTRYSNHMKVLCILFQHKAELNVHYKIRLRDKNLNKTLCLIENLYPKSDFWKCFSDLSPKVLSVRSRDRSVRIELQINEMIRVEAKEITTRINTTSPQIASSYKWTDSLLLSQPHSVVQEFKGLDQCSAYNVTIVTEVCLHCTQTKNFISHLIVRTLCKNDESAKEIEMYSSKYKNNKHIAISCAFIGVALLSAMFIALVRYTVKKVREFNIETLPSYYAHTELIVPIGTQNENDDVTDSIESLGDKRKNDSSSHDYDSITKNRLIP